MWANTRVGFSLGIATSQSTGQIFTILMTAGIMLRMLHLNTRHYVSAFDCPAIAVGCSTPDISFSPMYTFIYTNPSRCYFLGTCIFCDSCSSNAFDFLEHKCLSHCKETARAYSVKDWLSQVDNYGSMMLFKVGSQLPRTQDRNIAR